MSARVAWYFFFFYVANELKHIKGLLGHVDFDFDSPSHDLPLRACLSTLASRC